jgi:putative transposase
MSREAHVRFWEGVGVKLPRATHFLVLHERHLRRLMRAYVAYYNCSRPHQALANNSPVPRQVEPPSHGPIRAVPEVGGLHHRYQRVA